jgi:hypothetical protein
VQLNNRWKQLANFVKKYNVEVSKIQAFELPEEQARIRRLVASDLRGRGFECEELWHVDRMLATDDWAIYDFGGEGIDISKKWVVSRGPTRAKVTNVTPWLLAGSQPRGTPSECRATQRKASTQRKLTSRPHPIDPILTTTTTTK